MTNLSPPAANPANGFVPAARRFLTVLGPGLVVMLADTDVGSIVTAGQSGVAWGYRLLLLQLLLIPILYVVQELTVRLGVFTGRGHGELIRETFGPRWAWFSAPGSASAHSTACRAILPCRSPRRRCWRWCSPAPTGGWSGRRSPSASSNAPSSSSPGPPIPAFPPCSPGWSTCPCATRHTPIWSRPISGR